jgi:hypothetical protein
MEVTRDTNEVITLAKDALGTYVLTGCATRWQAGSKELLKPSARFSSNKGSKEACE